MKKQLVFATNNQHKLEEVRHILQDKYEILSLKDIHCEEDIPETADTLEGNALLKAQYVKNNYGYDCFSDDTGLEVYVLNNAPGVYSARYAGDTKSSEDNMRKLLNELKDKKDRSARFRTVIALLEGDSSYLFEGIVEGEIIQEKRGTTGFGYDPIFVPDGYSETFSELGSDIKNKISHRAEAVKKLKNFLHEKI
ncbi:MAG: non-canonical purine NTP diphosphatase [Bacteroidales bacterium]|nr:non-canonical purine NTP diphosphatase [Bacteroidales bacterium]